jgi:hypothetical protein
MKREASLAFEFERFTHDASLVSAAQAVLSPTVTHNVGLCSGRAKVCCCAAFRHELSGEVASICHLRNWWFGCRAAEWVQVAWLGNSRCVWFDR